MSPEGKTELRERLKCPREELGTVREVQPAVHDALVAQGNVELLTKTIAFRKEKLEKLRQDKAPIVEKAKLEEEIETLEVELEEQDKRLEVAKRSATRVAAL
jgi:hypothetical protein